MGASLDIIQTRLEEVETRIRHAAHRGGRSPEDVRIVAVTKTHPASVVAAAYELGLRHFGENRVEEGEEKIDALRSTLPDAAWHMIGHVQSRKASSVAANYSWLHALDRSRLARRLNSSLEDDDKSLTCLIQVNVSGEASKSGFSLFGWQDNASILDSFIKEVDALLSYRRCKIEGLMTMAPFTAEPETVRPVFQRTRALLDILRGTFPHQPWTHLSMGMSGDFEVAVEEGATLVRLGTALFGSRQS